MDYQGVRGFTVFGKYTVNEERFTGLNFRGFCSFQEYRGSFSVNILFIYKLCIMALFNKTPQKLFHENFIGLNL